MIMIVNKAIKMKMMIQKIKKTFKISKNLNLIIKMIKL